MADALDGFLALNNNFSGTSTGGGFGSLFNGGSFGSILSAFGGGMSATAAYTSASNQKAALLAEAQTQANNATLAGWQADDAVVRGDEAANRTLMKGGQIKGTQRAAFAANGVDLGGDSAQRVLTDTDYLASVDAAALRDNAAREAWGYRMQAKQYTDKAASARSGAGSVSPWLSAGTSLLTSATNVASRWYSTNRAGG